jgi:hypothetical protein
MTRVSVIALLALVLLAVPLAAEAQPPAKIARMISRIRRPWHAPRGVSRLT